MASHSFVTNDSRGLENPAGRYLLIVKPVLWAVFSATLLWASALGAQTNPCDGVFRPSREGVAIPANPAASRDALAQGRALLNRLPDSAPEGERTSIRALFQTAYELSGGDIPTVYAYANALRLLRFRQEALRFFRCLDANPSFASDQYAELRSRALGFISSLQADIDAENRAANNPQIPVGPVGPTPPGPGVRVVPGPIGTPPGSQARRPLPTPHPWSPPVRTAGQISLGAGLVLAIAGGIMTGVCESDLTFLREANLGEHGWNSDREDRARSICDAGRALLVGGAVVAAGGGIAWYLGGRQVTDPILEPPPVRTIPATVTFVPTEGGVLANVAFPAP